MHTPYRGTVEVRLQTSSREHICSIATEHGKIRRIVEGAAPQESVYEVSLGQTKVDPKTVGKGLPAWVLLKVRDADLELGFIQISADRHGPYVVLAGSRDAAIQFGLVEGETMRFPRLAEGSF